MEKSHFIQTMHWKCYQLLMKNKIFILKPSDVLQDLTKTT